MAGKITGEPRTAVITPKSNPDAAVRDIYSKGKVIAPRKSGGRCDTGHPKALKPSWNKK